MLSDIERDALAAGTGAITFANGGTTPATLQIEASAETEVGTSTSYRFANVISGATSTNQVIDLRGLAYNQGSTGATFANGILSVINGAETVTLGLSTPTAACSRLCRMAAAAPT